MSKEYTYTEANRIFNARTNNKAEADVSWYWLQAHPDLKLKDGKLAELATYSLKDILEAVTAFNQEREF